MTAPWIVVVEDEPLLGQLLIDNLGREGYGTELITDGRQALDRLHSGGVDLVILDLMLPGTSGLNVLDTIRKEGNRVPVLILSALGQDDDRIKGLSLGADRTLRDKDVDKTVSKVLKALESDFNAKLR